MSRFSLNATGCSIECFLFLVEEITSASVPRENDLSYLKYWISLILSEVSKHLLECVSTV